MRRIAMLTALIGLALVIAVAAVALRLLQDRAVEKSRPGATPATAIRIHDYGEIDFAVRMHICRCGGRPTVRGEGPARDTPQLLRVAHLECQRCEREVRMYFDLSAVRH